MKCPQIFLGLLLSALVNTLSAQETLTLDQVFEMALKNNFDIKLIKKQVEIADNSATIGNAGLLPSVNANASTGITVNDTELEFAGNIAPVNVDAAQSTTTSLGVNANYILFNGLSGKNTYQKLQLNRDIVLMQSRVTIEATLLQAANAFFVLARANEQFEISRKNVEVSKTRLERAELAYELGTSLKTDLLSARVDLNSDSSALLNAQIQERTARRQLEVLLATELAEGVKALYDDPELKLWTEADLISKAQTNNASLKNAELQLELAERDYKISRSSFFPTLSVSGGYGLNQQQNEAGIVLSNTASGWNGSIALSYPLFNGFRSSTQRQNQNLNREIQTLENAKLDFELNSDIKEALDSYNQSYKLLKFERDNLESAEFNLSRTTELYNSGQLSSIQFREAQVALANAEVRLSNARMALLINELEILRLTGQILGNE